MMSGQRMIGHGEDSGRPGRGRSLEKTADRFITSVDSYDSTYKAHRTTANLVARIERSSPLRVSCMRWASAVDTDISLSSAVERAAERVFLGLGRQEPDLLIVFVSGEHAPRFDAVRELLHRE